jgi:hypothetical protein
MSDHDLFDAAARKTGEMPDPPWIAPIAMAEAESGPTRRIRCRSPRTTHPSPRGSRGTRMGQASPNDHRAGHAIGWRPS